MNLSSLVTIGSLQPKNLIHIIFDNNAHESTGGQPTYSNQIDISKIAKPLGYTIFSVRTKKSLENTLEKIRNMKGPIMILVKIQQNKEKKSERVRISPIKIKERFMQNI